MNKLIYIFTATSLTLFFMFSQTLYAEAKIELSISSQKVVANKSAQDNKKQGHNKTTLEQKKNKNKKNSKTENPDTQEAVPGEQLLYTIHYENLGEHAALEAAINTAIEEATVYKAGSASCESCEIVFSSDGEHFDSSDKLDSKPASYTHIRWLLDEIAAGEKGQVSYSVVVK